MAALKGAELERFLRKPDRKYSVILVYGPDAGLVNERSRALAHGLVTDPSDAFQLIRIDGDDVGSDTTRILDQANTLGLFGGSRAIWVRIGSRNILAAVEALLVRPLENPVVLEAGDLPTKHALRNAVERTAHAVALPCYADEARDLPRLIDEIMSAHTLRVSPEARSLMTSLLGADRLLSRREIEKVALYAFGRSVVEVTDVEAVMADASAMAIDMLSDAVFSGESDAADSLIFRSFKEGQDASMLIGAVLRHAMLLGKARIALDRGASMSDVERNARIFYKRSAAFQRQLSVWTVSNIESAIATLGEAQAACRRNANLGESLASRACLTVTLAARRQRNTSRLH